MNVIPLYKIIDKFFFLILKKFFITKKKNKIKKIDKILIIKLAAMGDALCLMPSLNFLKNNNKNSKIVWLTTYKTNPHIFSSLKIFDEIVTLNKNPLIFIIKIIRLLITNKFDVAIDFDQYYNFSEFFSRFAKISVGFKTVNKGETFDKYIIYEENINEKIQFFKLVKFCTKNKTENIYTNLDYLSTYKRSKAVNNLLNQIDPKKKILVVYAGSGASSNIRRWEIKNFDYIFSRLKNYSNIILCGGKDEKDTNAILMTNNPFIFSTMEFSLKDYMFFFKFHADLFFGNDGGFLHLAESQNLKSISIFGPSNEKKWGSLIDGSKVIKTSLDLDCQPCIIQSLGQIPKTCKIFDHTCLKSIQPEFVKDILISSLKKK